MAKRERLLARPLIARIGTALAPVDASIAPQVGGLFSIFQRAAVDVVSRNSGGVAEWRVDPDTGACTVPVAIDYADQWRGREKEVLDTVKATVEGTVTFLTDEQRTLLERSPLKFLGLHPAPLSAELMRFEKANIGGSLQVIRLTVAAAPESRLGLRHVAIVPNLVQLERQLEALDVLESASDGDILAPLRALVGLNDGECLLAPAHDERRKAAEVFAAKGQLDPHQRRCLVGAMRTPHFGVIHGPPGSGKTTVISSIIQCALEAGERVLVVSPTHVAVDNVVEKLVRPSAAEGDTLATHTIPVRYATRDQKLLPAARHYWVGAKKNRRTLTLRNRLQSRLSETVPAAKELFARVSPEDAGWGPLTAAIAGVEPVFCGTPIGLLSCDVVRNAEPGAFGLLVVDEVSKLTLPEFLAIAVKARRWVVVGDPAQLPPHNDAEESAVTLDDVVEVRLELVCSAGAFVSRTGAGSERGERLVVVSSSPERVAAALRAHLAAVAPKARTTVTAFPGVEAADITVCALAEAEAACRTVVQRLTRGAPARGSGEAVEVLVERGLKVSDACVLAGARRVDEAQRAQAILFEQAFPVFHSAPWFQRSGHPLRDVASQRGFEQFLPSQAAIAVLRGDGASAAVVASDEETLAEAMAERFAVNALSVFDWLSGIPPDAFEATPLKQLASVIPPGLKGAIGPYVGHLRTQYRMHPNLSRVPRELFYFGEALHDSETAKDSLGQKVELVQVEGGPEDRVESNEEEVNAILEILQRVSRSEPRPTREVDVMIITPYRHQEELLNQKLGAAGALPGLKIAVCTLDRCQGREAEVVIISLVKSRAGRFLDSPKRWNVALTRAKEALFMVGNIEAFRREARANRRGRNRDGSSAPRSAPPSLMAHIIAAYDRCVAPALGKGPFITVRRAPLPGPTGSGPSSMNERAP